MIVRNPRSLVLLLAGFLGGTSAGWILHHDLTPAPNLVSVGTPSNSAAPGGPRPVKQSAGLAVRGIIENRSSEAARSADPALPPSLARFSERVRAALKLGDYTDCEVRLREIMRAIPVEDLPAAYLQAKKLGESNNWSLLSSLGERWSEIDPHAAMAFALKQGDESGFGRNGLLQGALSRWIADAPGDATAWVEASPPGTYRDSMVVEVVEILGGKNPETALQMLSRNATALNNYGNVALNFFSNWAGRDPQAAASGAMQLNGRLEQEAVTGVANAWADRDPRAALHWIDSLPKTFARQNLLVTVGREWADIDVHAELEWARGLKDDASRRDAMASGVSRLASSDLGAALELIQALPAGEDHDQALQTAVRSAAQEDARSALKILDQLPAGPTRSALMIQLCEQWSESEPRAALDWLVQNAPPGTNGSAMIENWMGSAPEDAIAWAEALPAGGNRDSVMSEIVNDFVSTDLERAQSLFAQLSPAAQGKAAGALAEAIFQESPEKARVWAQALPDGAAQKSAFSILGDQWASADPSAAAQWLEALPAGKARDAATATFCNGSFQHDPEAALAWSQTISDSRDRDASVEQLTRRWLHSDSAAARAWLDANTQITPDEKDRILNGAPAYGYRYFRSTPGFPY